MSPDAEESIRCSEPDCSCAAFRPGSVQLRSCDLCGHSWVAHALEKLQARPASSCGPAEVALPGPVFDLSSLVLYGAQAVPVQLKILLDRLYSILSPEQVGQILLTLGWSLGDYIRGYMLQYPSGEVLDCWSMVTPEEEPLVLKQFLRFGETRPIVELMMLQCVEGDEQNSDPEPNSKKKKGAQGESRLVVKHKTAHLSPKLPGGQSMLLPFHFPHVNTSCLLPSTEELVSSSEPTQILQTSRGREAERHEHEGRRTGRDDVFIWKQAEREPAVSVETDPDQSSPLLSLWRQNSGLHTEQRGGRTRQKKTAPITSDFSSSHLQNAQKLQRSPSSLQPLPSFSSSFLCSLHASSFSAPMHPLPSSASSSLHPLPSSLCTVPSLSPGGCRKGRVSCGVCGKSFYDKGTLKIHYNAVHLKIKHRCTVVGCSMVFSSLRSRNRHSANPNPRLHTGACRDGHLYRATHANTHTQMMEEKQGRRQMCRERASMFWQQGNETQPLLNGHLNLQHGCQSKQPQEAGSPSPSFRPQTVDQNSNQNQIPLVLLPAGTASCCTSLVPSQQWRTVDALPKKKPRKSSMPMKIKRESTQSRRHEGDNEY